MSYLLRASALIVVDESTEVKYKEAVILARGPQVKRLSMRERTHLTLGTLGQRLAFLLGGPADGTQVGCEVRRHAPEPTHFREATLPSPRGRITLPRVAQQVHTGCRWVPGLSNPTKWIDAVQELGVPFRSSMMPVHYPFSTKSPSDMA